MEKKGFKWQMAVELVFMAVIIIALFMPALKISGEKYLKIAVDINKYAKEQDSKTASEANVDKKVINKYKENTSRWDDKIKEFDDEIEKEDKGKSISQLMYVKWLLTADDEIDDIKGINKITEENSSGEKSKKTKKSSKKSKTTNKNKKVTKNNKKGKKSSNKNSNKTKKKEKKLSDSNVKTIFKFMALFTLIPVFLAIAGSILILVTGKTNPVYLLASSAVIVILRLFEQLFMPGMIWNAISDYVRSFTLVDEKILAIDGVGSYSIKQLMTRCTGIGTNITLAAAFIMLIFGILLMTVLKPKAEEEAEDKEWDFGIDVRRINDDFAYGEEMFKHDGLVPDTNETAGINGYSNISRNYAGNFTVAGNNNTNTPESSIYDKGYIYGLEGQYKDFSMQISSGEEIILGRDPSQAMLVFDYPKISRKHCGIRYDSSTGGYYVIDYSSNGTELSDGILTKPGEYVSVAPGTIVYLAGKHEALKLG